MIFLRIAPKIIRYATFLVYTISIYKSQMILSNSTRDLHYKSKSQEMYLQINATLRYGQQPYVPINKRHHHSCDGFRVHVLKSADAHRNERLEFITVVGRVHHMETVGEDQVEGEVLGEGLREVSLELLQDV